MPWRTGGIQCLVSSPPGPSTLMISAPRSPRIWVQYGPASTREKSATSRPASGPGTGAGDDGAGAAVSSSIAGTLPTLSEPRPIRTAVARSLMVAQTGQYPASQPRAVPLVDCVTG